MGERSAPEAEFVSWEATVCAVLQAQCSDNVQRAIEAKAIFEACKDRGFALPKKSDKALLDEVLGWMDTRCSCGALFC